MSDSRHFLAQAIYLTRQMRGMTQQELADKLNKTTNAVSNWENGHTSPPVDVMVNLCKVLDITPNQLCGWDTIEGIEEYLAQAQLESEKTRELMEQKKKIDEELRLLKNKKRPKQ